MQSGGGQSSRGMQKGRKKHIGESTLWVQKSFRSGAAIAEPVSVCYDDEVDGYVMYLGDVAEKIRFISCNALVSYLGLQVGCKKIDNCQRFVFLNNDNGKQLKQFKERSDADGWTFA